ncbi:hypothetical protein AHF37_09180 [Paragonimus kellicotti]|nr:hypothetical protein AHF37_09180 [Paragonimus kellicotti]
MITMFTERESPILGYVNLCSRSIVSNSGLNEQAYSTFLHEIAHSLGFSPTMYALLRDENGEPRTKRHPITQLPDLGIDSNGLFIPDKTTLDTVDRIWKSAKGTFVRKIRVLKTPTLLPKKSHGHLTGHFWDMNLSDVY